MQEQNEGAGRATQRSRLCTSKVGLNFSLEIIIKPFCLNAADFNPYLWIHKNDNPPNPACGRFNTLEAFKLLVKVIL